MIFRNKILAIFLVLGFLPTFVSAETRNIIFPVDGEATFRNDFLEPRDGGARQHLGNDILADKHTPLVAAVNGVISYIPYPEPSWGYMITIQDSEGYQYRYLHINNDNFGTDDGNGGRDKAYAPGLKRGSKVSAGQLIGWVGDSGNAEWTVPHLHFEIRNSSKVAINPYDSLVAAPRTSAISVNNTIESPQIDVGEAGVDEGAELIFTIELQEGMQGWAIKELQRRLKAAGYFNHGTLTEYFGPVTKTSLQNFQQANGIAPTGILGLETRTLLNKEAPPAGSSEGALLLKEELFEGMDGEPVLQVQLKLKTLGYFDGEANGEFDWVLREALRKFQAGNDLNPTGYVSYPTWNKLNDMYRAAPKETIEVREVSTMPTIQSSGTLSVGSRGSEVVTLQDKLRELGHFSPNVISTGYFGPVTRDAVISFQKANGIDLVGYVGPETRAALNSTNASSETTYAPDETYTENTASLSGSYKFTINMEVGSRGGEVVELQDKLRELGHFSPNVISTGYFGPVTKEAVTKFQASKGINAIGIVGPKTRAALNSI